MRLLGSVCPFPGICLLKSENPPGAVIVGVSALLETGGKPSTWLPPGGHEEEENENDQQTYFFAYLEVDRRHPQPYRCNPPFCLWYIIPRTGISTAVSDSSSSGPPGGNQVDGSPPVPSLEFWCARMQNYGCSFHYFLLNIIFPP